MTGDAGRRVPENRKNLRTDVSGMKEDGNLMRIEMTAMRHDPSGVTPMRDVHGPHIAAPKTRPGRIGRRLDLGG